MVRMEGPLSKKLNIDFSDGANEEVQVDLTPMLDVVFILLIFFIVSTSFVKESGLEVSRPSAKSASTQQNAHILVAISSNNDVWIQNRNVDLRAVRANVERLKAESPDGGVVIQADKGSDTNTLIEVMDQVKLAGIDDISIAATKAQD